MLSKRKALKYGTLLLVVSSMTLGVVFAHVVPAPAIDRAPVNDRPGNADGATFRPWGDVSKDAVDSGGIERDLDGNAYSLQAQ